MGEEQVSRGFSTRVVIGERGDVFAVVINKTREYYSHYRNSVVRVLSEENRELIQKTLDWNLDHFDYHLSLIEVRFTNHCLLFFQHNKHSKGMRLDFGPARLNSSFIRFFVKGFKLIHDFMKGFLIRQGLINILDFIIVQLYIHFWSLNIIEEIDRLEVEII